MTEAVGTFDEVRSPSSESLIEGITPLTLDEIVEVSGVRDLPKELGAPAEYLLTTTGKNLRSTMLLQCANAGKHPDNPLMRAGAVAMELGHMATLAHDDVVDDGKLRRGLDAVGVVYGAIASGFVGGSLFARAGELIVSCGAEPTRRFGLTAADVCAGEMMEFEDLFDPDRSVERYHLSVVNKTASLFGLAAWLGAWLADAGEDTAEAFSRFGIEFGVAFQMADDLLDLLAPESETGKMRGKDLKQGVYTLAVIHALKTEDELRTALEREPQDSELPELIACVERSGGLDLAIGECLDWANRARATLDRDLGLVPLEVRERLTDLLHHVLARIPHPATSGANGNGRRG